MRQVGSSIYYSLDLSGWSEVSWPITIINADAGNSDLTVQFRGDFKLFATDQYFIAGSSDINFRGYNGACNDVSVFTLSSLTGYPGLIQNGTSVSLGHTGIEISDVYMNSVGSTLSNGGGWIVQSYFNRGTISYCGSNGSIPTNGGGIVGEYSIRPIVSKCYSSGNIGMGGGGIIGRSANTPTVSNSYSTGLIGAASGGIVGQLSLDTSVSSVYSTGDIGFGGGGIIGGYTGNGSVSNAYSTGSIAGDAGGIIGISSDAVVTNSYTSGALSGGYVIISGSSSDGATNYSEGNHFSSGWSTSRVSTVLTGINTT